MAAMTVIYTGTNPAFQAIIREIIDENSISEAVATGRFRSNDTNNRRKYRRTAALLDLYCSPYSKKLHRWHHMECLRTINVKCMCGCMPQETAVELDFIDIDTTEF